MEKHSGYLFDLYEHPSKGVVLWLVGEDGKPKSFHENFETVFYARGIVEQLHELGMFIRGKHTREAVNLKRVTKEDLFDGPMEVMGIGVCDLVIRKKLFQQVQENFSNLIYYDIDVPLTVRYAAAHNVFMMAHCEITAEPNGKVVSIRALDTPDELEPKLPQLRILSLTPNIDPSHTSPKYLVAKYGKAYMRLPLDKPRELISVLNSILTSYDPDVIESHFGDGWLFPYLFEISKKTGIVFNPNRDSSMPVLRKKAVNFYNYGRAHHRHAQVHLHGRWHVDVENGMTYKHYELIGAIEQTRFSSLSAQEVARRSPGASISAMQLLTALKRGVLIPYVRQKGEIAKTFNEYYRAARGGLVLQPRPGIFQNVAVLDFSSKMASIMIKYNVSPETVVDIQEKGEGLEIPELGVKILPRPGLVPETLKPMRDKRLKLKRLLKNLDKDNPRYKTGQKRYKLLARSLSTKAVSDSLKWLAVVCYGRLGFANAIFGRLNAHETVSFLSRKSVIKAKLTAEAMGLDVLSLYIDSLAVARVGAAEADFQALADAIEKETDLPIEVENIYSWFAFPCSRQNPRVTVSNRFFGIAENGKHKIRGVASRRGDTCAYVANIQKQIIKILAKEKDPSKLTNLLPEILKVVQEKLSALKKREVPLNELVITQILSRELNGYSVQSSLSTAARQLQIHGITVHRGQPVRYIYTSPGSGVFAWDLPASLDPQRIDVPQYKELILRAVYEVIQPLGVTEKILRDWLFSKAGYITPPGLLASRDATRLAMPLFNDVKYLYVDNF